MSNRYLEIPGEQNYELPPLLIGHTTYEHIPDKTSQDFSLVMDEAEDMLGLSEENEDVRLRKKFDLTAQMVNQYHKLQAHWLWGNGIMEWIRQCEITFEYEKTLKVLLYPDIWPHASRASFVSLLVDKGVPTQGVGLQKAVGLRLTFRQPPPIGCFSNLFLFNLNSTVADSAYQAWSNSAPGTIVLFPPERFHFDILQVPD